jgi:hypothetical protein
MGSKIDVMEREWKNSNFWGASKQGPKHFFTLPLSWSTEAERASDLICDAACLAFSVFQMTWNYKRSRKNANYYLLAEKNRLERVLETREFVYLKLQP